jgi:hypothetical protein
MSDQPHVNKSSWGLIFNGAAFAILVSAILYVAIGNHLIDKVVWFVLEIIVEVVIVVLLGSLINAVFVRIATRVKMKFNPPYSMAWKACATASFLSYSVTLLLGLVLADQSDLEIRTTTVGLIAGFIIAVPVYGEMILHPQTGPIGLLNGLLVNIMSFLLVMFLVGVPIGLIYFIALPMFS